jgi:small ligand-binding sensory domain FIST
MRCAAALSTHPIPAYATGDVIAELLALDQPSADLVVAFATPAFGGTSEDITETIRVLLLPKNFIFIVSDGIIGAGSEVTSGSGIALWSLWLDDSFESESVQVFSVDDGVLADEGEFTRCMLQPTLFSSGNLTSLGLPNGSIRFAI